MKKTNLSKCIWIIILSLMTAKLSAEYTDKFLLLEGKTTEEIQLRKKITIAGKEYKIKKVKEEIKPQGTEYDIKLYIKEGINSKQIEQTLKKYKCRILHYNLCKGEVEIDGDALINYSEAVPRSMRGNNNTYNMVLFVSSYGPNIWTAKKEKDDDDKDDDDDEENKDDEDDDKSKINPALSKELSKYYLRKNGVNISGKSKLNSLIYAPHSKTKISGQSTFTGSIFSRQIKVDGDASVQIITSTAPLTNKKTVSSVTAAAATDFKLGNVYSYPNPAKAGQTPTLHIEVGQADTVEIKIFNIAAELVHTTALLNPPAGGPVDKNADGILEYEYPWPGTNDTGDKVASGVYIYYIEAKKSGYSPITVIKKCVIIR